MNKKKRFLSLLIGTISSFSVVGAKEKNSVPKAKVTVSSSKKSKSDSEILEDEVANTDMDTNTNKDMKDYDKLSIDEQIMEKLKNEIIPNLNDISKLDNKDDTKFFSNLLSDNELKQNLKNLVHEEKFSEIYKLIFENYNVVWEDEAVLDLKKSVQKVSYHDLDNGECVIVLDNAKDKLGQEHCYNFSDFYIDCPEQEAKDRMLRCVFCDLAISDFYKLESISYKVKGICDLMKQAILKRYVGDKFLDFNCLTARDRYKVDRDNFFAEFIEIEKREKNNTGKKWDRDLDAKLYKEKWDLMNKLCDEISKNRSKLNEKIYYLLSRSKYKIDVPWLKKALDSRTPTYTWIFGNRSYIRWSRLSLANIKATFSKTLKSKNALRFLRRGM